MNWIHENPPHWDERKTTIISDAPAGIFELANYLGSGLIPGEWWRVEDESGSVLGYGWMDTTWGDAEILLAVAPDARKRGVGSFILDHLEKEAATRGLRYLHNVVRPSHPDRERITRWLEQRRFAASSEGVLRRLVRPA